MKKKSQYPGYGNGELATVARFGTIVDLKFGKTSAQNDKIIVSDQAASLYREIQIDGLSTDLDSNQIGWAGPWRFETDTATGDILAPHDGKLQRYVRTTGSWIDIVGGGGTLTVGDDIANQAIATNFITSFIDPTDSIKKRFLAANGMIYRVSPTNILEEFLYLPRGMATFAHKIDGTGLNVFYCSGGQLYKYNYNSGVETHLSWPSTTLNCSETILYNPERNSIIFPFHQNGLNGVAEYDLD